MRGTRWFAADSVNCNAMQIIDVVLGFFFSDIALWLPK
jgi:hypothetical protein